MCRQQKIVPPGQLPSHAYKPNSPFLLATTKPLNTWCGSEYSRNIGASSALFLWAFFGACGSVLSLKFNDVCAGGWKYYLSVYQHIKLDFPFPFLFHSNMLFIFMLILGKRNCCLEHVRQYLRKINDSGHKKMFYFKRKCLAKIQNFILFWKEVLNLNIGILCLSGTELQIFLCIIS